MNETSWNEYKRLLFNKPSWPIRLSGDMFDQVRPLIRPRMECVRIASHFAYYCHYHQTKIENTSNHITPNTSFQVAGFLTALENPSVY